MKNLFFFCNGIFIVNLTSSFYFLFFLPFLKFQLWVIQFIFEKKLRGVSRSPQISKQRALERLLAVTYVNLINQICKACNLGF